MKDFSPRYSTPIDAPRPRGARFLEGFGPKFSRSVRLHHRLNFLCALRFFISTIAVMLTTLGASFGQSALPSHSTPVRSAAEVDATEKRARESGDRLIPTCRFEGARCGYIDRNGKTAIEPQFSWADRFIGSRAIVRIAGKYGAIDTTGRLVIAAGYDALTSFDRGQALVVLGDGMGVIDQDGAWVVPANHGLIIRIADDAFLVAEPPYSQNEPLKPLSDRLSYAYGKRWGIVARGGRWVVRPTFVEVMARSDALDGLFWATDSDSVDAGPRWQLMRADGSAMGNVRFSDVQQIESGEDRAVVERSGRWGAVNRRGEIVVELKFDWLGYFRKGWAPYKLAGREGRIDRDGKILSDGPIQPTIADPNAQLGATVDGEPLHTDKAGTKLLGTDHPKCRDGRHLGFEKGRWTILSAAGKPAPDIAFQYVSLECNAPSIVKRDGKWGYVSVDGKILTGRYFDQATSFHGGVATIVENGLWAAMGEDGSFLLGPLKLARGTATRGDGKHLLEFEEGYRTLDKALVAKLAQNPDVLTRPLPPRLTWSEGLAALFDDKTGKWGFVDSARNFVIAPQFDAVGSFTRGVAWAAFPDRREWCQIEKTGRIASGTRCQCHQPFIIFEHYKRPPDIACYDDGVRIVRGLDRRVRGQVRMVK